MPKEAERVLVHSRKWKTQASLILSNLVTPINPTSGSFTPSELKGLVRSRGQRTAGSLLGRSWEGCCKKLGEDYGRCSLDPSG